MRSLQTLGLLLLAAIGISANPALAKVSAEEAARLGKDLTKVGAEKAGNADGSIPVHVGKASFTQDMFELTPQYLEDLRVRLLKDIQKIIANPEALGDILEQSQAVIDAEPDKANKVIDIIE
ncbi:MAG: hypothetical protein R3183_12945, partial [Oleiphilaceae bacterium]|nr:hypothetical protein [Oleiphilaceae bacterium]